MDFRAHLGTDGTEIRLEIVREDLAGPHGEHLAGAERFTGFSPDSITAVADVMLDWVLSRVVRANHARGTKPPLIRITVRTEIPTADPQPVAWQFDWPRDWLPEAGKDGFTEFSPSAAQVVGDKMERLLREQLESVRRDSKPEPDKISVWVDAHVPTNL